MRETKRLTGNSPQLTPSSHDRGVASDNNVLFGKYEVGKLLGCGAFAKVYHARNITTGQSVAVKIITKTKIAATSVLVSNIKREILIMRQLRHPNIVKLHEVMATKTKIYVVMEYVKGGELFTTIAKYGRFSEDSGRKYFQQLISAIGYCHSRGIYHRDLKPENLLLDENGNLKVSDFGLSAVKDQQVRSDGLLHTLCGTPAYVAPEILSKKGYDGAKVDVWSCGIVLFVLTAGYLPFHDSNLMGMYKKICKGEFRCPKWISSDFKQFLYRLLDPDPNTRITVEEITRHPWFNMNYDNRDKIMEEDEVTELGSKEKETETIPLMNAFDLISFSSGLDLSGLFQGSSNSPIENSERLVLSNSPEQIMEKIDEATEVERGLRLRRKKDYGVELEGPDGNSMICFELHRLTPSLVVMEVGRKGKSSNLYDDLWKNKIKPKIVALAREQV